MLFSFSASLSPYWGCVNSTWANNSWQKHRENQCWQIHSRRMAFLTSPCSTEEAKSCPFDIFGADTSNSRQKNLYSFFKFAIMINFLLSFWLLCIVWFLFAMPAIQRNKEKLHEIPIRTPAFSCYSSIRIVTGSKGIYAERGEDLVIRGTVPVTTRKGDARINGSIWKKQKMRLWDWFVPRDQCIDYIPCLNAKQFNSNYSWIHKAWKFVVY